MTCMCSTPGCSSKSWQWGAAAEATRGCWRSPHGHQCCRPECYQETAGQQAGGKNIYKPWLCCVWPTQNDWPVEASLINQIEFIENKQFFTSMHHWQRWMQPFYIHDLKFMVLERMSPFFFLYFSSSSQQTPQCVSLSVFLTFLLCLWLS